MRGKAQNQASKPTAGRITPACAGKRENAPCTHSWARDHPRVCGEKAKALGANNLQRGSPPRMRGKGQRPAFPPAGGGITPACAGKSCGHQCREYMPQDHPRVYGEKRFALMAFQLFTGSSPRMRGKERHLTVTGWVVGITPAYAGKRYTVLRGNPVPGDHPRVCGEKTTDRAKNRAKTGSPPRVRGKGLATSASTK